MKEIMQKKTNSLSVTIKLFILVNLHSLDLKYLSDRTKNTNNIQAGKSIKIIYNSSYKSVFF